MDQCNVVISTKRALSYMAKKEYFDDKKVAWFFRSAGCIPVDRSKKDDAATSQWGSGWCLPTLEQWEELRNNTTGTWTVRNGSSGFLFTANNGRCLFLPATTIASPYSEEVSHLSGSYWSNLLYSNSPHFAWAFCFHIDGIYDIYRTDRYHGMAVRPVCSAK